MVVLLVAAILLLLLMLVVVEELDTEGCWVACIVGREVFTVWCLAVAIGRASGRERV